jgi:hypothetical protein
VRGRKRKVEDGSRSREPAAEKGKSLTFILSLFGKGEAKSSYGGTLSRFEEHHSLSTICRR